jgi:hypothetical protein
MTSLDRRILYSNFHGNPPVSAVAIKRFENEAKFELPKDYADFLQQSDGGEGFIGPNAYVMFWRLRELAELNAAYRVEAYAPGFFVVGSDGGGEAYAFDRRDPATPIVSLPFVGMEPSVARVIACTFQGFLEALFVS